MDGPAEIIDTKTSPDFSVTQDHDRAMSFLAQHQSSDRHPHSLLAEYVTGIPIESYDELTKKMIADKQTLRDKYQLPDESLKLSDPKQYIEILQGIAQKNDLTIKPSSEYKPSVNTPLANGSLYDDESHTIYLKPNYSPTDLEHELIHGLQDVNGGDLAIEVMEYEAYECAVNVKGLINPESQKHTIGLFWGSIGAVSLRLHYENEGLSNPWEVLISFKIVPKK
jgi:hypothetical protein